MDRQRMKTAITAYALMALSVMAGYFLAYGVYVAFLTP